MDICFLTCICLWQILQIQTSLFKVVGPVLVSTSPDFVSSSASHPTGPHGRHAHKTVNRGPIAGGGKVRHNLHLSSLSPLCQLHRLLVVSFGAIFNVFLFIRDEILEAKYDILVEINIDILIVYVYMFIMYIEVYILSY